MHGALGVIKNSLEGNQTACQENNTCPGLISKKEAWLLFYNTDVKNTLEIEIA